MIDKIQVGETILGIVIRDSYKDKGLHFFTPEDFTQQLAYMNHPKDHVVRPHFHNAIQRVIHNTMEILFIKSGKIRLDFYDDKRSYLESRLLEKGDIVLLSGGGHGLVMLEDSEIVEVKQGPFVGVQEKTRFDTVDDNKIRYER
jgi:hypothetical protein